MRLNQFLDKLAVSPRAWFPTDQGCIRITDVITGVTHCPITWMGQEMGLEIVPYGRDYSAAEAPYVGGAIGLSWSTIGRVIQAVDDRSPEFTLRRRFLVAVGLTEDVAV